MRALFTAITCLAATFAATSAEAGFQYGFTGVTKRNASNTAVGEAQSGLEVNDLGGGLVEFIVSNSGGSPSSITEIYFDDSGHFSTTINSINNGPGVNFSVGATPGELAGAASIGFETTPGLSLDSDYPVKTNGVNPGESVGVVLELASGLTYDDVITGLSDSSLRVGIYMRGFSRRGKESFVNKPGEPPVVPEPTTAALASLACFGLLFRRKKQSPQSNGS